MCQGRSGLGSCFGCHELGLGKGTGEPWGFGDHDSGLCDSTENTVQLRSLRGLTILGISPSTCFLLSNLNELDLGALVSACNDFKETFLIKFERE